MFLKNLNFFLKKNLAMLFVGFIFHELGSYHEMICIKKPRGLLLPVIKSR